MTYTVKERKYSYWVCKDENFDDSVVAEIYTNWGMGSLLPATIIILNLKYKCET
jgi:hypothetical protein